MYALSGLSVIAGVLAVFVGVGGAIGWWPLAGTPKAGMETITMALLVFNSVWILRWAYRQSAEGALRAVALLCTVSLCLCVGGDVVNFNLPDTYYRYGGVVKHDYLADSVRFFAPGYLLLLVAAVITMKRAPAFQTAKAVGVFVAGMVLGGASFAHMYLPGTASYVAWSTGLYCLLITSVGTSGVLLIYFFGVRNAPAGIWAVGVGLLLAALADAVIGSFWI